MNEKKEEILQKRPFWEHLTKIQKELLLREARIVRYQAGNSIYSSVRAVSYTHLTLPTT